METLRITYEIIVPIFLVVGLAAVVDRVFHIEPSGLSRLVVYLFTPFLVFDGLVNSELTAGEAGQLALIAMGTQLVVALVAWWVARLAGFDGMLAPAFIMTVTLINAGNYGIPLNQLAFGDSGEDRAIIFFVMTVLVTNTLGVFLASSGSVSTRQALRNVLIVPLPYAAALGLLVNLSGWEFTGPAADASSILAQAAIPGMLAVLGIQLSRTSLETARANIRPALMASALRLAVAPAIALALTVLLGTSGLSRKVSLMQSAMPTAVISGVLATEFGADVAFVTATILISTVLSIGTLSVLLTLLM